MRFYLVFVLVISCFVLACSRISQDPAVISSIPASATPTPSLHPAEKIDPDLERTIAQIAQNAQGKVGVGTVLIETGDAAYLNRSDHFAMQSVYKLPIAMAAAQQVDKG